jgi:phage-related protein
MPPEVCRDAGYQLWKVQRGDEPSEWKPMTAVGTGVREIRVHEQPGEFRVIYLATRSEAVYVLHCFRKQSARTETHDIEIATKRFKAIGR